MRCVFLIFIYDDREVDLRSQESHLWTLHQINCLVDPDSQSFILVLRLIHIGPVICFLDYSETGRIFMASRVVC